MTLLILLADVVLAITLLQPAAQGVQTSQLRYNASTGECWRFPASAAQVEGWASVPSCLAISSQGVSWNAATGECRVYDPALQPPWTWAPQCQIGVTP